ncbi:hypothetical protein SAMN05216304_11559 [Bosea sp. OK403]|nr:hypothetical protein SAMN05216304_11559 [Bosea sp. OK403]
MSDIYWTHDKGRVRYSLGAAYWAVPLPTEIFYAIVPKKAGERLPPSLRGKYKNVESARRAVEGVSGPGHSRKELERAGSLWPGEVIPKEEIAEAHKLALASTQPEASK